MTKSKAGTGLYVTLPAGTMEMLNQYCESMELKKSVAINILIKQALDANMAIGGMQSLVDIIKAKAEQQINAEKYGIKHDGTIAEDFR